MITAMRVLSIVVLTIIICCSSFQKGFAGMTRDTVVLPQDTVVKKDKNGSFIVLPVISYSPETSFRWGAVGVYFFRFKGSGKETFLSTIKLPITYTAKKQWKVRLSYEIFLHQNKHQVDGHFEFIHFPNSFYGIGPDAQESDEESYTSDIFSVEFNYLAKLNKDLFLGPRYQRHQSKIVEVEEDGLLNLEGVIPGAKGAVVSGLGIVGRWDRRDNVFNSATGPFLQLSISQFGKYLGSEYEFEKLELDFRHYIPVLNKRHILAINAVLEQNWGNPTFERMALLGGGQIMRGHLEGRYRDKTFIGAQVEYRFPLFRKKWIDETEKMSFLERLGIIGFAGVGNVANRFSNFEFDGMKHSYGFGLRYLVKPKERANIRIDFGFGTQKPGFYLNLREAF